jgi:hypothetical protein
MEELNKQPRVPKRLICDCFSLKLFMTPRASVLAKGERFAIITRRNEMALLYASSAPESDDKVKVRIVNNKEEKLSQVVELTNNKITFGTRRYFKCGCGKRVNTLYFKHNSFKCRHCHNLAYEVTRYKKDSMLYKINRHLKAEAMEQQVKNITYGNIGLTRKARQLMTLVYKLR